MTNAQVYKTKHFVKSGTTEHNTTVVTNLARHCETSTLKVHMSIICVDCYAF